MKAEVEVESLSPLRRARAYLFDIFEGEAHSSRLAAIVNWSLIAIISLNVAAFVIETVEPIGIEYASVFDAILYASIMIFTLEYLLRLWVCIAHESAIYSHWLRGRIRYMLSPLAIVDFIAIAPFYLAFLAGVDLRFLRLLRLLWILKVTRYLPAMATLGRVLKRERRTLIAVMTVMLIILFVASSVIYLLENERQPEAFASIPHAIWWGVATLTTVGYGDVVPVSPMGRMLGVVIMLLGIGTFALPAGILASAFAEERRRRDFMLTWNLVANAPFFAFLSAHEIARIAALLHPREVMAKEVIFHKGDEADSMFFVVTGEVKVELPPHSIRLKRSDFFGEVALVYHRTRTATVIATTRVELLELEAKDLYKLFDSKPQLRERITREAERRLARG